MYIKGHFAPAFTLTAILAVVLELISCGNATLPETIKWTGGNFEWPSSTTKNMYKSNGKYIPKNVIATRVAMHNNEAIVALPRYKRVIDLNKLFNFISYFIEAKNLKSLIRFVNLKIW